jgi:hypothetical protein
MRRIGKVCVYPSFNSGGEDDSVSGAVTVAETFYNLHAGEGDDA